MASYKELFEVYRQAWREDWEASSALTEKAKTYLLVIGLVFGYSIFNLNAFLGLIENRTSQGTLFADSSLVAIKILFSLYLLSFSVALLTTLFSFFVRRYKSLPTPETLDEFRKTGLSDEELDAAYYQLANLIAKSVPKNRRQTERQAFWLRFTVAFLIGGGVTLVVMSGVVFWTRVW